MNHKFPWFSFERRLHWIYKRVVYKRKFNNYGSGSFLSPYSEIINMQHINIGCNVNILSGAWIMAIEEFAGDKFNPYIEIGDKTYIGHQVTISCVNFVFIGNDVTLGDNVYLADSAHSYDNIQKNIMEQKLRVGKIVVGNNAWIGKNSVITHNVEIGEHSIVGANSFVSKSIPPFTVVSGNPAVPVKVYDFIKQAWVPVQ